MPEVKSAEEATQIAHSFIKKYRAVAYPLKAVRQGDVWLMEMDVGPVFVKVARLKIDAKTGEILEYSIPEPGF